MRRSLALLSVLASPAWAGPTGLNTIPTADLVPLGQLSAVLQNGNTALRGGSSIFHEPEPVPQLEVGLPRNFEGGLDLVPAGDPRDYRPQLNIKWRVLAEDYYWPAVAVGAEQLGVGFTPSYFLVASRTLNYGQIQYQKFRAHHRNIKLRGIRAHAGMLRTANAWRALLGSDVQLSDHFVLYTDWISGSQNAVSLGGVLVIDRENSIAAAALRGNREDRLSGVLLNFTHTFAW
jgi:exopolysaccharide biosynthesis protein YbjH